MRTREMHMGALAVLLCVTVLCVAVFGALTLVTAAGDLRMARRTGEYTRSWYDLENQGQLWCSQIRRWQGGNCQLPPDTVLEDGVAGVRIQDQTGKLEIWLSLSDGTLLQWDHTAVWQPEETPAPLARGRSGRWKLKRFCAAQLTAVHRISLWRQVCR